MANLFGRAVRCRSWCTYSSVCLQRSWHPFGIIYRGVVSLIRPFVSPWFAVSTLHGLCVARRSTPVSVQSLVLWVLFFDLPVLMDFAQIPPSGHFSFLIHYSVVPGQVTSVRTSRTQTSSPVHSPDSLHAICRVLSIQYAD